MRILEKMIKTWKNKITGKKAAEAAKKIFLFCMTGITAFSITAEKGEELYSYNLIRSIFKPKSDESQPVGKDEKETEGKIDSKERDRLAERIEKKLRKIYETPTREEIEKHLVWIEVPVWRLKDGKKISDKHKLQVLDLLADEVKEIFEEIYRGKEKFPIKYLHGYSWRGSLKSLHSTGRAVDINPEENPQVSSEGRVIVGKKWEPGSNPYSITPEGDVVRAFTRRGWTWGKDFRTKDYMHFGFKEM